jgi:hypothetical protein
MKYCPLLVAAKWHRENPKYENLCLKNCECLESRCALWDSQGQCCGFLGNPIAQRLAAQN